MVVKVVDKVGFEKLPAISGVSLAHGYEAEFQRHGNGVRALVRKEAGVVA